MSHKVKVSSLFSVAVLVLFLVTLPMVTWGQPIKVGYIGPLTGFLDYLGTEGKDTMKLWEKLVNEKGGILARPVKVYVYDCKAIPQVGVDMLRKAALEDKVEFFIYGGSSGVVLASLPVAQELKTVYIVSQGATSKYFDAVNQYTFRMVQATPILGYTEAWWMSQKYPKMKKVAYIFPDYEFGRDVHAHVKKYLTKFRPDIQNVAELWPATTAVDMKAYAAQLAGMDIDTVVGGVFGTMAVSLVKELRAFGALDKIEYIDSSVSSLDLAKTLRNEMVPTWGGGVYDAFQKGIPENDQFVMEWKKAYGKASLPGGGGGTANICAKFLRTAIEKAGTTDTLKVIRALEGLTIDTIAGKFKMREWDHQAIPEWMPYGKFAPHPDYPYWILTQNSRVDIASREEEIIPAKRSPGWRANSPK